MFHYLIMKSSRENPVILFVSLDILLQILELMEYLLLGFGFELLFEVIIINRHFIFIFF